ETAARRLQQSSSSQGRAPSLRAASSLPSPPSYVTVVVAIRPSAPQRVEDSDRVGRFVQRSSPSPSATKLLGASVHHLQI
uniref:Uncharacterized protein n=1 Tax=Aegilops tauschii subsp. strangulata TaxID=200361 RepID=A0A453KAD9_AEGTS